MSSTNFSLSQCLFPIIPNTRIDTPDRLKSVLLCKSLLLLPQSVDPIMRTLKLTRFVYELAVFNKCPFI
jgi:hypothetical protein